MPKGILDDYLKALDINSKNSLKAKLNWILDQRKQKRFVFLSSKISNF